MENTVYIASNKRLFQLTIENEEKEIWRFFVEKREYAKALKYAKNYDHPNSFYAARLYAKSAFEEQNYKLAAELYADSDEKFEEIALQFMTFDQWEALLIYLSLVQKKPSVTKSKVKRMIIATWRIEIMIANLNKCSGDKAKQIQGELYVMFFEFNKENLLDVKTVTQLLLSYGRIAEYMEICLLIVLI